MKLCKIQIHVKVIMGTNFLSNVVMNQDCNLISSWDQLETFANYFDLGLENRV